VKLQQIDSKIERAKEQIAKLRKTRHDALLQERRNRKLAAKYKIGDIITYGTGRENENRPMLITQVTQKPDGTPCYAGLQIIGGKVSRVWGNTGYWYRGEDSMKLVGNASNLQFYDQNKANPNGIPERPRVLLQAPPMPSASRKQSDCPSATAPKWMV